MRASGIAGPLQNPPRGSENLVEYCLLEETRLGVPLTRMVRCDQGDGNTGRNRPLAEFWRGGGTRVSGRPPRAEEARHRNPAERHDDPQVREEHRFPLQIRLAPGELRTGRPVRRRGAADRCDDVAISELKAIVPGGRGRPVREPRAIQGPIQPIPAAVPGEGPPRPVAAVGRGGEADNQEPRRGVAPSRDGPAPILPVAERCAFRSSDRLAVSNEPRTLPACGTL